MSEPRWGGLETLLRSRVSRGELDPTLCAVLEAASPGLALLDGADRLVAWNPELARLCGPTLPLRAGMPATNLVAPDMRDGVGTALDAGRRVEVALASAGLPQVQMERRRLREQGALLRVAPVGAAEQTAQNAAAARLQTVGALAGGIAHDFNNLLTAISGSAEAALARDPEGDAAPELRQVMESAGRGAALVKQLLAFARQQALNPRVVDLNRAVADMGGLLRRLLGSRVRLLIELEEPGRCVRIDPTQLDQVIMNLALNARDAMPEGGELRIATNHAVVLQPEQLQQDEVPPGRYAVLEVSDSGRGIAPDLLPRIFDPFFTTRRGQGGHGLGLSTVHGIVRQSGGFIGARSKLAEGTTFRIWLPRHDGPAEPVANVAATAPATRPPTPPTAAEAGAPILLVEDEAPLLRLAERALTRAGFAVLSAASAEEAIELLEAGAPKPMALVSDVVMPGMDGLALAARLRERDPGLPVLLVSGYAQVALGRDLDAERLKLLPKPYGLADLVSELRTLLPGLPEKVA
jgi:two-component system cell cycle sensor histidine kinase/response regulator CckA